MVFYFTAQVIVIVISLNERVVNFLALGLVRKMYARQAAGTFLFLGPITDQSLASFRYRSPQALASTPNHDRQPQMAPEVPPLPGIYPSPLSP